MGTPATPDELGAHRAVNYVSSRTGKMFPFEFEIGGERIAIPMKSVLTVNDGSTYITAGVLGYGIIQPSRYLVSEFIAQGQLKEILTGYRIPPTPLSIVYPHREHLSSRVRAFTELAIELARKHPDLQP